MSPSETLIRHDLSKSSMSVITDNIRTIVFSGEKKEENRKLFNDRISFTSKTSNSMICRILDITPDTVTFSSPFVAKAKVARSNIATIVLNELSYSDLLNTNKIFDYTWFDNDRHISQKQLQLLSPRSIPEGEKYQFPENQNISLLKNMRLDIVSFEFETDVIFLKNDKSDTKPDLSFIFAAASRKSSNPSSLGFELKLDDKKWSVSPLKDSGLQQQNTPYIVEKNYSPYKRAKLQLHVALSPESAGFVICTLKLNGEIVEKTTFAINNYDFKKQGSFSISTNQSDSFELINPRLRNIAIKKAAFSGVKKQQDLLQTTEEEIIEGNLKEYKKSNETIRFTAGSQEEKIDIPDIYITAIAFENDQAATQPPSSKDNCTLLLKDGSTWSGEFKEIKNNKLTLIHSLIGKISVPLTEIANFSSTSKKGPAKSKP